MMRTLHEISVGGKIQILPDLVQERILILERFVLKGTDMTIMKKMVAD